MFGAFIGDIVGSKYEFNKAQSQILWDFRFLS